MIRIYEAHGSDLSLVRECSVEDALAAEWKPWTLYECGEEPELLERADFERVYG